MKIIVTHMSPDLDAIGSVWVVKKFLPGWEDATVEFVPAGQRLERVKNHKDFEKEAIVYVGEDEIMHVDTGLGPLDHHQTSDQTVCGASRSWDFVLEQRNKEHQELKDETVEAVSRIIALIVEDDQFLQIFRPEASADYHDFSLYGIIEGALYGRPNDNKYYVEFGRTCLDYLLYYFESKIWGEKELASGIEFETKYGKAIGVETMNDSIGKIAQKKGYVLTIRKNTKKGNVSIKTVPRNPKTPHKKGIDLTLAYEQLQKMDPDASWYLHISKKMLLNGSTKSPSMKPTRLTVEEIVNVLKRLYK